MPFLIVFVVIPLVELAIFAAVSGQIGLGYALLFALFTAVLGGYCVKRQGLGVLAEIRNSTDRGRMPLGELFDGACLIAAGALLITPGFLTDAIGFALLIPRIRKLLREAIRKHTNWAVSNSDPNVIEGEYETLDDPPNS